MASVSKKARLCPFNVKTDDEINKIASEAADIQFPWDNVCPMYFTDWINMFSKAHGTSKQLMFMSILPTISSLLGLSKVKATTTYQENLSLFSLCISPPSGGKNQCFAFGCKSPVAEVEKHSKKCILLDKFTEVGLRQHLIQNEGVALIINEEMEDTMRQINSDREGGTLCRLFDGDSVYINTGINGARVAIEKTSVSIGGFMQVRQFFKEIYPTMVATQSGFDLRFLFSIVKPEALTRKETEPFAEQLSRSNMPNLLDLYKAIYAEHEGGDIVYTLSEGALSLFDQYDERICQSLNEKWRNGQMLDSSYSESGKERRLVLRLSVVLHVIYTYSRRQIFQSYGLVPRIIPESCMKYAIALMEYFQQQRKEINKVLTNNELDGLSASNDSISSRILSHPGPVVTVTNFRQSQSSKLRREWTPAIIKTAMEKLANKDFGEMISMDRTVAFVKFPPQSAPEDRLAELGLTKDTLKASFKECDLNLPTSKKQELISRSAQSADILEALN